MSRKSIELVSSFAWPRWFKAAASIFTFAVLIMLPRAAWSQRVASDPSPETPCVTRLGQSEAMTRVAFHPWCDLRELVRTLPVLDETGKALPKQVQLRNIYEANKDRVVDGVKIRHTVMRGCVLAGKPSSDADEEEKQYCTGLVNYFAAPSNDSIAIIEVPRSKLLSHTEKLEKLTQSTCATLARISSPDKGAQTVLEDCRKSGIEIPTQVVIAPQEQPQSKPPQFKPDAGVHAGVGQATSQELKAKDARIAELENKLADMSEVEKIDNFQLIFLSAFLILMSLLFTVFAWLYFRERGRNLRPIQAEYERKIAEFKQGYDTDNEELTLLLTDERDKTHRLEKQVSDLKQSPTVPPHGQIQRDNEKLVVDLAKVRERVADLELGLSAETGSKQTLQTRVEALKKSLDSMTAERNNLQKRFEVSDSKDLSELKLENEKLLQENQGLMADLSGAEERVAQAKKNQAALEQQNMRFKEQMEGFKEVPGQVIVSVRGHEKTINELKEKNQEFEIALTNAAAREAELTTQTENLSQGVAAKDLRIKELLSELEKSGVDLSEVVEENVRLVRENQVLKESSPQQIADSAVIVGSVESPQDDSNSTVIATSSTNNENNTLEQTDARAMAEEKPSRVDEKLRNYLDSEVPTNAEGRILNQLTDPRPAKLPPLSKDVTDTIPPHPSTPPRLVIDESMPDEILTSVFASSLKEVGLRRLSGRQRVEYVAQSREDIYVLNAVLDVKVVCDSQHMDSQAWRELGSPKSILDCQSPRCRKPIVLHVKTQSPGQAGI